jgi:myo-inositol-1(or 4)-monophosphatase
MVVVTTPSAFVSTAIDAALQAGKLLQQMLPESRVSKDMATKRNPSDFVTRGDRMAEALIARVLRERFSDHGNLAEEGTSHAGAQYRWIIDPLDRTTNFVQGGPLFAVSRTRTATGAGGRGHFAIRLMDERFGAERGGGHSCAAASTRKPSGAYFVQTGSVSAAAISTTPRGTQTGP